MYIEEYPNALPDSVCDQLITEFNAKKKHWRFTDNEVRKDYALQIELFQSMWPLRDQVEESLRAGFNSFCEKWEMKCHFSHVKNPGYKMQMSTTGGGFTFWHSEQGSDEQMIGRFAVWMYYLNDDFEGGETAFKFQNIKFKPKKGTLLIWPAGYTHMHRGEPNLVGTKYILTGWFRYPSPPDPRFHNK